MLGEIGDYVPVIIWSKPNTASNEICLYLIKEYGFSEKPDGSYRLGELRIHPTHKNVLDFEPPTQEIDFIIVPSTHRSVKNVRCFTVHTPGNWSSADMGGQSRTLNVAYPTLMYTLLKNISKRSNDCCGDMIVSYEVDHHGPTLGLPITFVEIGSTEKEWKNPEYVSVIGDSIMSSLDEIKEIELQPYMGIGGGHYAPRFTALSFKEGLAFGHILPKYRSDAFNSEMIRQGIEKNVEGDARVVIDWKGLNSELRDKAIKVLDELGVDWLRK